MNETQVTGVNMQYPITPEEEVKTHVCDEQHNRLSYADAIVYREKEWHLEADWNDWSATIIYCPFCGIKL